MTSTGVLGGWVVQVNVVQGELLRPQLVGLWGMMMLLESLVR